MGSRLELQTMFEEILGSRNVYYQPPESIMMSYPAIKFSLSKTDVRHANNSLYKKMKSYEVILIDEDPEPVSFNSIIELPYCSFDRQYPSDNLNHFVFTLYY